MTDAHPTCPNCGRALPVDADTLGLCPVCLVANAIDGSVADEASGRFTPPAPEELDSLLDGFTVVELIGQGGMGAVYRARQEQLGRDVAIKVFSSEVSSDPAFAQRFELEARVLARLDHPNIVDVYDYGQAGPWAHIVMELIDGPTLQSLMRTRRFSLAEACHLVAQTCDALQCAHREGVVHRDVKPANILLMPSRDLNSAYPTVKLLDFGVARLRRRPYGQVTLTAPQQVFGTPHYIAPEALDGHTPDHRADQFALGVVLYELLTGHRPLGQFPPASDTPGVPRAIDQVVARCLATNPDDRYASMDVLRVALQRAAEARDTWWTRLEARTRRRMLTGIIALPILTTGVYFMIRFILAMTVATVPIAAAPDDAVAQAPAPQGAEAASTAATLPGPILVLTFDSDTLIDQDGKKFVTDITGNAGTGAIVGATSDQGISGQALRFDGAKDYVDFSALYPRLTDNLDAITVAAWIHSNGTTKNPKFIFDAGHYGNKGVYLGLASDWFFGTPGDHGGTKVTHPAPETRWQHVVGTWNGKQHCLYIDGKLVATEPSAPFVLNSGTVAQKGPRIGGPAKEDGRSKDRYFKGLIDEMVVFPRAIDANEVAILHRRGAEGLKKILPTLSEPAYQPIVFKGHAGAAIGAAFTPDSRYAVTSGDDKDPNVRRWDVHTGQEVMFYKGPQLSISNLVVSADGSMIAAAAWGKAHFVTVWKTDTGGVLHKWPHARLVTDIAISPDGTRLLYGGFHGLVLMRDLKTGQPIPGTPTDGQRVAYSPTGTHFAVTTSFGGSTVTVQDARTMKVVWQHRGHNADGTFVIFDPSGKRLITAAADGEVAVWNVANGEELHRWIAHDKRTSGLAISPDGKMLMTGGDDNAVAFWDMDTAKLISRLQGHTAPVRRVAISPDGKIGLSTSGDGTARTWDLTNLTSGRGDAVAIPGANVATPATTVPSPATAIPAPPAVVIRPATDEPVDPDTIVRPEYQNKIKLIKRVHATLRGLLITQLDSGGWAGKTSDIIITATPNKSPDVRFVRPVGQEMTTSFDEAVRAVKLRYPKWDNKKLEISFSDKYSQKDGGSAGAAFGVLLLSMLENVELDPKVGVTGDIAVNWKVLQVGGVATKVNGAIANDCPIVIIPKENAHNISDMAILHDLKTLWQTQVFSVETLPQAMAIARKDRDPKLAEAVATFTEIGETLDEKGLAYVQNDEIKQKLARVVELAPNHESAIVLQKAATGQVPRTLSLSASMYQVFLAAEPFRSAMWQARYLNRRALPEATVHQAQRDLRALRTKVDREALPLLNAMYSFIEASDRYAENQDATRKTGLKRAHDQLNAELTKLNADERLMSQMLREGG